MKKIWNSSRMIEINLSSFLRGTHTVHLSAGLLSLKLLRKLMATRGTQISEHSIAITKSPKKWEALRNFSTQLRSLKLWRKLIAKEFSSRWIWSISLLNWGFTMTEYGDVRDFAQIECWIDTLVSLSDREWN